MPKISIIVPVYNAEKYLSECIESILAQTFIDWELLLIDDGSTDNSHTICHQYASQDPRIIFSHKTNGGVSSARNMGLDNARGRWITFIDSDDWIDPDYLESLLKDQSVDIAMCGFKFQYADSPSQEQLPFQWSNDKIKDISSYMMMDWTVIWGCIVRKDLFENNEIRFPESLKWCEDYHVIIRLLYFSQKTKSINKFPYNYRQHDESLCHQMPKDALNHALKAYDDIIDFFKIQNAYKPMQKALAHRSLWHSHIYALNPTTFNLFLGHNPDKRHYIFSCKKLNLKMKIITWCLTHHLRPIAYTFVRLRKQLKR